MYFETNWPDPGLGDSWRALVEIDVDGYYALKVRAAVGEAAVRSLLELSKAAGGLVVDDDITEDAAMLLCD